MIKPLSILVLFVAPHVFADGYRSSFHAADMANQAADIGTCRVGELDPSPSSPPNNSDDPGTTDTNCWEINHTFSVDHSKNPDGSSSDYNDFALDMNYGVKPGLQAKLVVHYNSQSMSDPNAQQGPNSNASAFGRIEVGAKQRLYENEKKQLVISWFPTIDFMTPGTPAVGRGLPDTGTNLTLPVLISKRYGPVVFVSNAGVILSLNDPTKPAQALLSAGAGINVSESTILTGEVYRTSDLNLQSNSTNSIGIGATTKLTENVLLYFSLGKTLGTTADGSSHVYALAGVKVLFGKGGRSSREIRYNFKRRFNEQE